LDEMKQLMRTQLIVDGRNVFNKEACFEMGFIYRGVGR
jgi:hypothetical protein